MDYSSFLNAELPRPEQPRYPYRVLDLFAGCGGLALGFEAVGFDTVGYEMAQDACDTYNANLHGECRQVVLRADHDWRENTDVVVGGPPCQPFSVSGLQNGSRDSRDGFPAFLAAVEHCRPELVLFENVRGMLYRNREYFHRVIGALSALNYAVEWKLLNAVDYGVPQNRERLFVVAHRGDWRFPNPRQFTEVFTAGDALGDMAFSLSESTKFLTPSMDEYVARYEKKSFCTKPRDLHLDRPSRTVTCRNLNGATGDMLRVRLPDGRRKRLAVREGARLQSFPDWFQFLGSEGSQFNQVGNAVPPLLAKALAKSALKYLRRDVRLTSPEIQRRNRPSQLCLDFSE